MKIENTIDTVGLTNVAFRNSIRSLSTHEEADLELYAVQKANG